MFWSRRSLLAVLFLAAAATASPAQVGQQRSGQKGATIHLGGDNSPRGEAQRTIVGHVTGPDGKAAPNAVVYLKDANSTAVKTVLVDETGAYQFGMLPMTVDYQLWAQDGELKTTVKPISSFIETTYLSIPLHLEKAAAAPSAK